jgi:hypothetical protein
VQSARARPRARSLRLPTAAARAPRLALARAQAARRVPPHKRRGSSRHGSAEVTSGEGSAALTGRGAAAGARAAACARRRRMAAAPLGRRAAKANRLPRPA